ncbi:MAG: hypothetical protein AB7I33_03275 [Gemmatimonadales bacterium]
MEQTGLEEKTVRTGVGGLLAALMMSARGSFGPVERLIPDTQALILEAAPPAPALGRTGEMVAFTSELRTPAGAKRLITQLGRAGLAPDTIGRIATALLAFLRQHLNPEQMNALESAVPGIREVAK